MRAVQFSRHGGPQVLSVEKRPRPQPATDEVLVAVEYCGVNRMDEIVRDGPTGIDVPLPHTLGADVVGTVAEVGDGVGGITAGSRVVVYPGVSCGRCEACAAGVEPHCREFDVLGRVSDGGYAEFLAVPTARIATVPDDASPEALATIPVAFTTAWRMLQTKADLGSDDILMVLGATGDVGLAALALGRHVGARVLATTREAANTATLERNGADDVLVTEADTFGGSVRDVLDSGRVDVVVDYLGATSWPSSLRSLVKGGTVVSCGHLTGHDATTDLRFATWRELSIHGSTLGTNDEFRAVLDLAVEEDLALPVAETYPLEEARAAHERLSTDPPVGKVLLSV